jgi:glutathione S-transferase
VTTEVSEAAIKELYEIFAIIDEHYFPNGNEWIAGENVTVADFAYVATISTLIVSFYVIFTLKKKQCGQHSTEKSTKNNIKLFQEMGASLENYPRLKAWFNRCKTTFPDYEEINGKGAQMLGGVFKSKLTKGF